MSGSFECGRCGACGPGREHSLLTIPMRRAQAASYIFHCRADLIVPRYAYRVTPADLGQDAALDAGVQAWRALPLAVRLAVARRAQPANSLSKA